MNDTEELIKQLETAEDDTTTSHDTSVVFFLKKYNITPGDSHIGLRLLFKLYKATLPTCVDYKSFRREIGQLLECNQYFTKINLQATLISNELMERVSKKKKKVNNKGLSSFQYFMRLFNIEPGNLWIEARVLYGLYQAHYKTKNRRPPLHPGGFHKFAKLHLRLRINDDIRWYGIDKQILEVVTKEEVQEIRDEYKKGIKEEQKERRRAKRAREEINEEIESKV